MLDPLKDYPGYLLRRASTTALTELAKKLSGLDLRPTESSVLLTIDSNPNASSSEVGRLLEIASANLAPLIARLEAKNLIEREPLDGRSHALMLTSKGRALANQLKKIIADHEAALLEKIPASARSAFLKGLRTIWKGE